jgi:hypothetical protein
MVYAHWIIDPKGKLALSWTQTEAINVQHNTYVKFDKAANCCSYFAKKDHATHCDYYKAS